MHHRDVRSVVVRRNFFVIPAALHAAEQLEVNVLVPLFGVRIEHQRQVVVGKGGCARSAIQPGDHDVAGLQAAANVFAAGEVLQGDGARGVQLGLQGRRAVHQILVDVPDGGVVVALVFVWEAVKRAVIHHGAVVQLAGQGARSTQAFVGRVGRVGQVGLHLVPDGGCGHRQVGACVDDAAVDDLCRRQADAATGVKRTCAVEHLLVGVSSRARDFFEAQKSVRHLGCQGNEVVNAARRCGGGRGVNIATGIQGAIVDDVGGRGRQRHVAACGNTASGGIGNGGRA